MVRPGRFFAIELLRRAPTLGARPKVVIIEKKREPQFYAGSCPSVLREGCNYCAGSISPLMADVLGAMGLTLPGHLVEGEPRLLTVHGDWKSIELTVPAGRRMLSVFRGSRPRDRPDRYANFDTYLLDKAVEAGAQLVTAEVEDVRYAPSRRPVVRYRTGRGPQSDAHELEADFVVLAGGVNQRPGMMVGRGPLFTRLAQLLPGFRPPRVRRALICELVTHPRFLRLVSGEVHFVQYGAKDLRIEMSLLTPKRGCLTLVLIGPCIDHADPSQHVEIAQRFLALHHIRRLLPRRAQWQPACLCNPNMTVGAARNPVGDRIALIGDMVVSRLYKDGIFSAYVTARRLAQTVLETGVGRRSLRRGYLPAVRSFQWDNRFGEIVFLLNRVTFGQPQLSRILYQAVLTERKYKPEGKRRLARVVWKVASGDDTYGHILAEMFHPATLGRVLVGGILITLRNQVTERLFGLRWEGFGRYPTGVPHEDLLAERRTLQEAGLLPDPSRPPDFERLYSIKIKSPETAIWKQLSQFGEADRQYFTPAFIAVRRTAGAANQPGSCIRYEILSRRWAVHLELEHVERGRVLLYRVRDGFARGGMLLFKATKVADDVHMLSLYVAFDYPRPQNPIRRFGWLLFRWAFPGFVHDVIWNHALCKLKELAETDPDLLMPPRTGQRAGDGPSRWPLLTGRRCRRRKTRGHRAELLPGPAVGRRQAPGLALHAGRR